MIKASCLSGCRTSGIVSGSRRCKAVTLTISAFMALVLSACVSPSPSGEVSIASVQDIQQGNAETGLSLRWGGTIAKVHNKQDLTILEIVSRPLLRSGRPRHNDQTDGRFLAEVSGFLDPQIVSVGRDISVVGTVNRVEKGQVGEADYQYPVMTVFNYRIWEKLNELDPKHIYPHYRERDRFWHDWPYRRRSRVHGQIIF